ncbi:hypothetical protein J4E93_006823 [Alternaria ventricosa]|uniref:uncharacterized protein n=1 Tax=Alternaria ventricosa TaxID=1187951 RepID=UPI0020C53AF2|nr:uncharacterized protein J4E93_006823 [Alternaria ventricosa]KAI4643810.1 hypothetical protein J4E93_006823 [Alternaria ventricosa]
MAVDPLHLQQPGPIPLYVLLVLVVGICCYFFFIGTAAVRLWFYKGALGPAPEKFIVIKNEPQVEDHHAAPIHSKYNEPGTSAEALRKRRMTVFTHDSLSAPTETIAHSTAFSPRNLSTATATVNLQDIEDVEDLSQFTNPQTRAYLAEERRISRMPAFDADDCGTGDYFPDIPLTNRPIESTSLHSNTLTASHLGLTPTPRSNWLTISPQYIEYHAARTHLLSRNRSSCIHVTSEGERASRELLQEVTSFLVDMYPHQFRFLTKTRRKHVLNELTREDFEIEHGLQSILKLTLPTLSPYSSTGPLSHTQTFIQTRPLRATLASTLHIPRPMDFFAGHIADLHPSELLVRTETQMYARLPKSGAVIVTTRTNTETLSEMKDRMTMREKEAFLREIGQWGEEEARVKGRDLWIGVVERCLKGQFS